MAALAADGQRQVIPLGVVFADGGAGFHEACDHTRIDDRDFRHRMGLGERLVGCLLVADRHIEQDVAGVLGPHLRRAFLHRIGDAGHRGQRRPLHLDRLDRVAGVVDRIGNDKGDSIAHMTHLAIGQDRVRRPGEGIYFQVEQTREIAEILDVGGRQDRSDAGKAACAARIDGEFRVRVRRAQHQRMHRRLRRVVIGVAAMAADQCVVLFAKHALTDAEFDGSRHTISDCGSDFVPYCSGLPASANGFSALSTLKRDEIGSNHHRALGL